MSVLELISKPFIVNWENTSCRWNASFFFFLLLGVVQIGLVIYFGQVKRYSIPHYVHITDSDGYNLYQGNCRRRGKKIQIR